MDGKGFQVEKKRAGITIVEGRGTVRNLRGQGPRFAGRKFFPGLSY